MNPQIYDVVSNVIDDVFSGLNLIVQEVSAGRAAAKEAFDAAHRNIATIADDLSTQRYGVSLLDRFAKQLQNLKFKTAVFVTIDYLVMGLILLVDDVVRLWEHYVTIRGHELEKNPDLTIEEYEGTIAKGMVTVKKLFNARWSSAMGHYDLALTHCRLHEVDSAAPVPF
jgi:hypothetical protein